MSKKIQKTCETNWLLHRKWHRDILWEAGGTKYINAIINFTCENILFNIKNNVWILHNENLYNKNWKLLPQRWAWHFLHLLFPHKSWSKWKVEISSPCAKSDSMGNVTAQNSSWLIPPAPMAGHTETLRCYIQNVIPSQLNTDGYISPISRKLFNV